MSTSKVLALLSPSFGKIEAKVNNDLEFRASAYGINVVFGLKSSEADQVVLVTVKNGSATLFQGSASDIAVFTLSARPEDWEKFFQRFPRRPHQSYWGILRVLGHEDGVEVRGDLISFGRHARVWRLVLDRARDAIHDTALFQLPPIDAAPTPSSDNIIGRYTTLALPRLGTSRIFYETSGTGPQSLLLLHTAGADSRQFHALMSLPSLQTRFTMTAFDLPHHGRSSPFTHIPAQSYSLTEETYLACIRHVITNLSLHLPIVSGASMAGEICLAVALHASSLGVLGVIPCEAAAHLPLAQPIYEIGSRQVDSALLDPERVCGMTSPTSPHANRELIWHIYSSQALGVFSGDLKFYFKGWDGRGRIEAIDTTVCPVYMLTGEYDYSCTVEMSRETAEMIVMRDGVRFEVMEGLGHFPMTEDPEVFAGYLLRGVEFISRKRRDRQEKEA